MLGKLFVIALVLFLASFAVGTIVMIVKELISRKRAAGASNKKDDKEVDQSSKYK